VLALIPGTSRSGITITAGLLVGLDRKAAARFSFLLSIPAILMAAGYESSKLLGGEHPVQWTPMLLGVAVSAISAYACIHYFLKLLDRIGMLPFVWYRLLLGAVLLWLYW
jgi:undecaprenyl-diphosphatase